MRVLIVGGYGTFGGRIVQLLENEPRLTLIVAGRSLKKAEDFCRARPHVSATLVPAAFDRDGDLATQLADSGAALVIDASGPFQSYGAAPYRLVEACLAQRVNYLDLADGSDFVAGIQAYDAAARGTGLYILSGASSFPVLTAAVVRRLSSDMSSIQSIHGGIAPSPYAGVGVNVIRAIAGYAGQTIPLRRQGTNATGHPLTEHRRFVIAPPGRVPLRDTWFSLVDVPDLRVLPKLWSEAETVWMGAGPVPEGLHRALAALAWLVRAKLISTLLPLAPLMHWATNHIRWGEHRGGMFVIVEGRADDGRPLKRSWHLLAEGDDGPLIPSMAVEALVRKALDGQPPLPGARAATGDLELSDYETSFAARTIYTGSRDDAIGEETPLYRRLLGAAWGRLPREIRAMHDLSAGACAEGRAVVDRGSGWLANLTPAMIGFPKAAADIPVRVQFDVARGHETWTRTFGGRSFSSVQSAGKGRHEWLLCERFGPLTFAMALVPDNGRLLLRLRHWRVLGIPLPLWLGPRSDSYETVEDGRFRFHVDISHPLTGPIVRYRGWLEAPTTKAVALSIPATDLTNTAVSQAPA